MLTTVSKAIKRTASSVTRRFGGSPASETVVSIIVPAYNDEQFIARAVTSCLQQTHQAVEVVCVDDGSTDGTADVLRRLAADDERVKVASLQKNAGTHNARRTGLDQATGTLVMFLDGDDELAAPACARAAAEYERKPYDILHFATKVKDDGAASPDRVRKLTDWMCPVKGDVRGRAILQQSFVDHACSFSVACKAYPLDLVKRSFRQIGDVWADSGEDALEYFAIAANASLYRGLPQCKYYVYHLGDGLSERQGMTASEFDRVLRLHDSVEGMRAFLESTGLFAAYGDIYRAHWRDQLEVTLRAWYNDVRPQDQAACLKRAMETWPTEDVVDAMCGLGSVAVARMREVSDGAVPLTEEQLIACGRADGEQAVRDEFEGSSSYRLGRALSAPARKLLNRK